MNSFRFQGHYFIWQVSFLTFLLYPTARMGGRLCGLH